MITSAASRGEAASRFVDGIAIIARTRPTDRVTVIGENEIDLLRALAKRGYVAVNCVGLSDTRRFSGNIADVVVAPTVKSDWEFGAAAAEAKRSLKQGGTFIAELPAPSDAKILRFLDLLSLFDFTDISKRDDPSGTQYVCCRKLVAQA
jgi:hypothetical protein